MAAGKRTNKLENYRPENAFLMKKKKKTEQIPNTRSWSWANYSKDPGMQGSKIYRGADKSLARPGTKQATATEDFEFHISYL